MKPAELRIGDVVCYANGRFPFGDMEVVKEEDGGFYLHRPYITENGTAAFEECFWKKDSNFQFLLLRRPVSCTKDFHEDSRLP